MILTGTNALVLLNLSRRQRGKTSYGGQGQGPYIHIGTYLLYTIVYNLCAPSPD